MFFVVKNPDTGPVDPFFADVILLYLGENTPGSTTILDSSIHNATANMSSNVENEANPILFGTGSLVATGASGVGVPWIADYLIGTGDFCYEMITKDITINTGNNNWFFGNGPNVGAGSGQWQFGHSSFMDKLTLYYSTGSFYGLTQFGPANPIVTGGGPYHVVLARSGTTMAVGINGTRIGTATVSVSMGFSGNRLTVFSGDSSAFPTAANAIFRFTNNTSRGMTDPTYEVPTEWPTQ